MRKVIIALAITFICFSINKNFAQIDVGYIHISIHNAKKPLCKIDDSLTVKINDTILALAPGKHVIKIWRPTASIIDTTVFIRIRDTNRVVFKVKYTPEYTRYLNEYSNYRHVKNRRSYLSPVLIAATLSGGILANYKADRYVEKALDNREEYSSASSQSTMDALEVSFIENKKNYKKFVKYGIGLYSIAGILTANYIRLLAKQDNTIAPVYKEETLLSRVRINTYPDIAFKTWSIGLSMDF